MVALHHHPPLAFTPALPPHHKRGRLGEIQEGGRRVQGWMGGRTAFLYKPKSWQRCAEKWKNGFFQFVVYIIPRLQF